MTGAILGKLSAILAGRFRAVREDGVALPSDKQSGRGIHSFLAQLLSVVYHISILEQVTLVVIDPDVMVHLLHSLFSVPAYLYLSSRRIFA